MKLHIIFLLILISLVADCKYFKKSSPPIEISADQLAAEYKQNAAEADEKYNGETVIVRGRISHYAELNGVIGVYLKRNELTEEWGMICLVNKTSSKENDYFRIDRGELAKFTGTLNHDSDEFFISLRDCKVE